jgi:putative redox protein
VYCNDAAAFADAKQLPLTHVTVRLKHEKAHAADCAECETRESRIDRIEREIDLVGDFDDAQRARLVEIANRCPGHRTLESEVWMPPASGADASRERLRRKVR